MEAKATQFAKPKTEQGGTVSTTNKNHCDIMSALIPGVNSKQRYKVIGEYDSENRAMYFDMTTAVPASFFHQNAE